MDYLIIAGDRRYNDYDEFKEKVNHLIYKHSFVDPDIFTIISGCATGADAMAINYAEEYNIPLMKFPAKWEIHGKIAGFVRNEEMAKNASHLIAFVSPQSRGTRDMIKRAVKHKLKTKVIEIAV